MIKQTKVIYPYSTYITITTQFASQASPDNDDDNDDDVIKSFNNEI